MHILLSKKRRTTSFFLRVFASLYTATNVAFSSYITLLPKNMSLVIIFWQENTTNLTELSVLKSSQKNSPILCHKNPIFS